MAELKSGLVLEDGESLVMEIEAELWASSSNPIAMAFGKIAKLFAKILGYRVNGFLVITDRRVVEVSNTVQCYCVKAGRKVTYVLPSSVKEIGYTKEPTCGIFCPAYKLYYEGFTQRKEVLLAGADDASAQKAVDAFYKAISASQKGNV
ncbi:MAG: hypothetical protein II054_03135 [Treponema sp.]|jgi:hypothetical protein|nr:hypothetical protein [Treponema sp.]MBR6296377.1 hypothetical protein [Treponema sp.]MEE3313908.1 hypothetical protein [Treponema sp.]